MRSQLLLLVILLNYVLHLFNTNFFVVQGLLHMPSIYLHLSCHWHHYQGRIFLTMVHNKLVGTSHQNVVCCCLSFLSVILLFFILFFCGDKLYCAEYKGQFCSMTGLIPVDGLNFEVIKICVLLFLSCVVCPMMFS